MKEDDYDDKKPTSQSDFELEQTVPLNDGSNRKPFVPIQRKRPLTGPLVFTVLSLVLGSSFQFGYNTGVINNPQGVIEQFLNETGQKRTGEWMDESKIKILWSTAVAIFAVGGMIGSLTAGTLAERFGRKGALLLNNILAVLAAALMGFSMLANSYEMLIIGRLVIGVNCGINTGIVPMFLSEISPLNLRGGIGVMHQLATTSGILISQILGLPPILGTSSLWPLLLALTVAPAVYQLATLPFCPESPRYMLITQDKEREAKEALVWLCKEENVDDIIEGMRSEHEEEQKEERISIPKLFQEKALRMPLIISMVLQLSQQLSGINAVLYYSTSIFIEAGVEEDKSPYVTLSTGFVMVIMTIVSIPLMDRLGRKTLHLFGLSFMLFWAIFLTVFLSIEWSGAPYGSIVCVMLFTVGFAIGPGSIPWLIVAELFSQGPRPAAISIAFMVNWGANFVVGLVFPFMLDGLKDYVFVVFIVLLAFFIVFTWKFLPETKNKTFEEISAMFKGRSYNHKVDDGEDMSSKL